jgi:hypothetical protein
MLRALWSEVEGKAGRASSRYRITGGGYCENGYLLVQEIGPDTWQVALTAEGAGIAGTLFGT